MILTDFILFFKKKLVLGSWVYIQKLDQCIRISSHCKKKNIVLISQQTTKKHFRNPKNKHSSFFIQIKCHCNFGTLAI